MQVRMIRPMTVLEQQVERDGKMLTKAALTMPQMPLNCHAPTPNSGFRHSLLQVELPSDK